MSCCKVKVGLSSDGAFWAVGQSSTKSNQRSESDFIYISSWMIILHVRRTGKKRALLQKLTGPKHNMPMANYIHTMSCGLITCCINKEYIYIILQMSIIRPSQLPKGWQNMVPNSSNSRMQYKGPRPKASSKVHSTFHIPLEAIPVSPTDPQSPNESGRMVPVGSNQRRLKLKSVGWMVKLVGGFNPFEKY